MSHFGRVLGQRLNVRLAMGFSRRRFSPLISIEGAVDGHRAESDALGYQESR